MNDTTSAAAATRLVITHTFAAPVAHVYDAWTHVELLGKWFGPPDVKLTIDAFDFRVGGAYRMTMHLPDGSEPFVIGGVYREIVERSRLAFTWRWKEDRPEDEFDTLVTVEFKDRGSSTDIVLTHEQLKSEESRLNHERGWTGTFANLTALLAA